MKEQPMSFREMTNKIALYLGLLSFAIVGAMSFENGIDLFFCVLRGIGAFVAIIFLQRLSCRMLEMLVGDSQ